MQDGRNYDIPRVDHNLTFLTMTDCLTNSLRNIVRKAVCNSLVDLRRQDLRIWTKYRWADSNGFGCPFARLSESGPWLAYIN